jgi:hypothetical protein
MSDLTVDVLAARLDRLERENRRLRAIAGTGGVLLAAVLLMAQAPSPAPTAPPVSGGGAGRVLEAQEIVIKDPAGRVRGRLSSWNNGDFAGLAVYDAQGRTVAELGGWAAGGAALHLYDGEQKLRADVRAWANGLSAMRVWDKGGVPRAMLTHEVEDGRGRLAIQDGRGRLRLELSAADNGAINQRLWDANGKVRSWWSVEPGGQPFFSLRDKDERVRTELSVRADGTPDVKLYEASGKARTWLSLEPDGSAIFSLWDRDGRSRMSLTVDPAGSPSLRQLDAAGKARVWLAVGAPDGRPALSLRDAAEKPIWVAPQP